MNHSAGGSEECQLSVEGATRPLLPEPFFVIATQNPLYQVGTFPLPESQLDRFLMCIQLGYPDAGAVRRLLLARIGACCCPASRRRSPWPNCWHCSGRCGDSERSSGLDGVDWGN